MEGAVELGTQSERCAREDSEPEPVLEVDLASRVDSSEAIVENSDDATVPIFSDHQSGISSCPTPTRSPIETDLSLGIVRQLERSHDACDGQQDSRKSPDEDASVSENCTQAGSNGIEVRDTLLSLQIRVRDLEIQLKDRIDWAQQKVMQAAQTVSKERQELNAVRAERDEALRFKKEQKAVEESALRKKAELETALRKASAEVRRLEIENAEVRAEMEAAKLSAAESVAIYQEVAKREKKGAKRAQGWEKQKAKLQEELSEEKRKLAQLQQALAQANERHLQAEVRWRQEEKAKEEAIVRADKEKRAKEQAEAAFKRREEVTRRKVEQDKQRLRDDVERLTQELSTLRATGSHNFVSASWNSPIAAVGMMGGRIGQKEIERLVREVADLEQDLLQRDVRRDRECVMCMCEEMSVVFMPCAHQVVCTKCNELHEKQGMRDCPSCRTPIQQRIRVYGASS